MTDEVRRLREQLEVRAVSMDDSWTRSLSARKRAELDFHDRDRAYDLAAFVPPATEKLHANRKYYSTAARSREYVHEWVREHASGRVFLDYACGNGENAILAAQAGAALAIGIDISGTSIQNATARARAAGVEGNTYFVQADCESTGLPSSTIDAVLCSGMLHHLDLSYAFPELRRILKPGGKCLAVEALAVNPLIKLYRRLTPEMRTEWESKHILSPRDLEFARRFFEVENIRFWHFFSIAATPFRDTMLFAPLLRVADTLDRVALRIPGFRLMAWQFTFELVNRAGG